MKDSDSALPIPVAVAHDCGMTLRDYFAAKVMQSKLLTDHNSTEGVVAAEAYFMADAMLKARDQ